MKTVSAAGPGLSVVNFPLHGNNAPNETLVAGVAVEHNWLKILLPFMV